MITQRFVRNPCWQHFARINMPPWKTEGATFAPTYVDVVRGTRATFAPAHGGMDATQEYAQAICALIEEADKYVITLPVLQMADELTTAGFPLAPVGEACWLEWIDPVHFDGDLKAYRNLRYVGILIANEGPQETEVAGKPLRLTRAGGRVVWHDDGASDIRSFAYGIEPDGTINVNIVKGENADQAATIHYIVGMAAAICELIRHPRAVRKEHRPAQSGKLKRERGRLRRGPARPAFTEVLVHVTHEEEDEREPRAPGEGPAFRKKFHHVRPFARKRLGKTELVVGHWRGDPKLGVCVPRSYRVVP